MKNKKNSHFEKSSPDEMLDKLLATHPVETNPDFTKKLIKRIQFECMDMVKEDFIDEELSKKPIRASASFTAKTLARIDAESEDEIHQEDWPTDTRIDELLTHSPVAASTGFTDRVLSGIREEKTPPARTRGFYSKLVKISGIAAAVAVILGGILWTRNIPYDPNQQKILVAGTEAYNNSRADIQTESWSGNESDESYTDEMLFLAENLDGADSLLDTESLETLAILLD